MDLIVDNIDLFESFTDISVGLVNSGQVLIHLNELRVVVVGSWNIVISGINLQVLQSPGQLLVVLLQAIDLGLASRDSLEKGCVRLLTDLEATNQRLNISHSSMHLDLLESIINCT